jgi:cellulose biosynthesis protein BcsQ
MIHVFPTLNHFAQAVSNLIQEPLILDLDAQSHVHLFLHDRPFITLTEKGLIPQQVEGTYGFVLSVTYAGSDDVSRKIQSLFGDTILFTRLPSKHVVTPL